MKAVAPGKLILSGEHSVVYGKPAIAMAIDRSAVFELTPQAGDKISFDLPGGTGGGSNTIMALRDTRGVGEYVHVWGTLTCGVDDYNGCQIVVTRLGYGRMVSDPDPV